MHSESSFLQDLVITLIGALLVIIPSRRLKLPSSIGFMLTGVLIGPAGLGAIQRTSHVETMAEIGVSVLLFVIGMEFSLARIGEIGRAFAIAGPLQVLGTMAAVVAILLALPGEATLPAAIFAGMLVALSSTAMVLRLLEERGDTHAPQGRLLFGILLFQDIAIVPMLVLIPGLAGNQAISLGPRLLIGIAAAVLIAAAARLVMPRLVNVVIRSGVRELYVMAAVAVCLGAALVTQRLGLSPALGAFLAGLLVSESEYSHQIVSEILPFRDLFSSLFFISIGMLLVPSYIAAHAAQVGGWLFITIALKAAVVGGIVLAMGFPIRVAAIVGISLAQVGEFSFVLASVGASQGLLSPEQSGLFFAVAVLSLILTPFLMRLGTWFGAATRAADAKRPPLRSDVKEAERSGAGERLKNHVIVAGYGVNGKNVARSLRELGIAYVVLEMDPTLFRRARSRGERVVFGDVSRIENLRACALDLASVVVLAISDRRATRAAVTLIRRENPGTYVIARTRQVSEVQELEALGADEAIPEEYETSIAIVTRVLRHFHVPGNIIRLQESALRREGYSFLRGRDVTGSLRQSIERMITGATTDTFFVEPDSPAVGRTLAQLDLRGKTRALVVAMVRNAEHQVSPEPDVELQAGDILVLVGDHQALDAAFTQLGAPQDGSGAP